MSLRDGLVIGHEKNIYRVWFSSQDIRLLTVRGKMRFSAEDSASLPVVGDWIRGEDAIEEILPRRSLLARKGAGATGLQPLAANVDYVLITSSLNQDLNWNRLDRYLTLAFDSGAQPVILLTKKDLNPQWESLKLECELHAPGVMVFATSIHESSSWEPLKPMVSGEKVSVLIGSSGVGKSTLTNSLLGFAALDTGGIRLDDDKGRHTTTSRSMWRTASAGWIVDTPGMRELQMLDHEEGLSRTFNDVEDLFEHCRFRDCRHDREPGCAVKQALEEGRLDFARWESYGKLQREIEYQMRKQTRPRSR